MASEPSARLYIRAFEKGSADQDSSDAKVILMYRVKYRLFNIAGFMAHDRVNSNLLTKSVHTKAKAKA